MLHCRCCSSRCCGCCFSGAAGAVVLAGAAGAVAGPVDPWQLLMALKCGLLVESTWALDTLSILLHDDHTIAYFGLQHMPGLLETLLEHFRHCLIELFGSDFTDLEISPAASPLKGSGRPTVATDGDRDDDAPATPFDAPDASRLDAPDNFTLKTRAGTLVRVEETSADADIVCDAKAWDVFVGFESSGRDWQRGHGDTTMHVLTHMSDNRSLAFHRRRFFRRCKRRAPPATADETPAPPAVKKEEEEDETPASTTCESAAAETPSQSAPAGVNSEGCRTEIKTEPVDPDIDKAAPVVEVSAPAAATVSECERLMAGLASGELDGRVLESLRQQWEEEEEKHDVYHHDSAPLLLTSETQIEVAQRCVCISNILRSLSFVPGNGCQMAGHWGTMLVLGRLILLHHVHPGDSGAKGGTPPPDDGWWREALDMLRENTLVVFANIGGQLSLQLFPESICLPILDGLLHWAVCASAYAHDLLPHSSCLSPQRLALEALCKLSVCDTNMDLLLATPPFSRIVRLVTGLVRRLSEQREPVLREFAIVLLASAVQGAESVARAVALYHPAISLLLDFIEGAEQKALQVASTHGVAMLRDNPDMMGTSLDMLRRTASVLLRLAQVPENRPLFSKYEGRLLHMVVSQILDQQVAAILTDVLYCCCLPATWGDERLHRRPLLLLPAGGGVSRLTSQWRLSPSRFLVCGWRLVSVAATSVSVATRGVWLGGAGGSTAIGARTLAVVRLKRAGGRRHLRELSLLLCVCVWERRRHALVWCFVERDV